MNELLNVQIDERTVNNMLEKAINERVEELAKQKYFMTMEELTDYLNLSRPTIMDRLLKNGCPYYKNGTRYMFKRDEIDKFLNEMTMQMSATQNDIQFFEGLKGGVNA